MVGHLVYVHNMKVKVDQEDYRCSFFLRTEAFLLERDRV